MRESDSNCEMKKLGAASDMCYGKFTGRKRIADLGLSIFNVKANVMRKQDTRMTI